LQYILIEEYLLDKKKILITGGTGLLGKALILTAPENTRIAITHLHEITSDVLNSIESYKMSLDDSDSLLKVINDFKPDVVFHTAGMGSVDEAEKNQEYAKKINLEILSPLVKSVNELNALLVFISSNAVYEGDNPPYSEKSEQKSVNYYGELTKTISS
jgi:dTDP-4-dehydrorhamnose reductase